jgi:hypothetical protein
VSALFVWRYRSVAGDQLGESDRFADRASAEGWLRRSWEDLLDRDVAEVELVDEDGGGPVYRMSLREPDQDD